jgi:hypothetical protein
LKEKIAFINGIVDGESGAEEIILLLVIKSFNYQLLNEFDLLTLATS